MISHALRNCLALCFAVAFLAPAIIQAAPVRIATSNYTVPGEVNVQFVDAVTVDDGSLFVLTSGLALSQPRLRLTRYNVNGGRSWSRTILVPSIPVASDEALKPASLLGLTGGKVLVLSQRGPSVETDGVTVDIVGRVFNAAGNVLANRGIAPIIYTTKGIESDFFTAQATQDFQGGIWVLANGFAVGKSEAVALVRFNESFEPQFVSEFLGGNLTVDGSGTLVEKAKGLGICQGFNFGASIAYQSVTVSDFNYAGTIFQDSSSTITGQSYRDNTYGPVSFSDTESTGDLRFSNLIPSFDAASRDHQAAAFLPVRPFQTRAALFHLSLPSLSGYGELQPMVYPDPPQVEALPGQRFVAGNFISFGSSAQRRLILGYGVPIQDNLFSAVNALLLPPAPLASDWRLDSLRTDAAGGTYLAGGPPVGGKESLGILVHFDVNIGERKLGVLWQLTNPSGSFKAKRILSTTLNRIFAVGVNDAGTIGVQLFQEATYFRGISVTSPFLRRGAKGSLRLLFAESAPAGGYVVQLSKLTGRFNGIPTRITIPEGKNFAEIEFDVLRTAPVGPITISARGDLAHDLINPVHTTTVEIQ